MGMVKDNLMALLHMRQGMLIGCIRRNVWDDNKPSYRMIRGNALIKLLSVNSYTVSTPTGPVDVHLDSEGRLIQFRAGKWKNYWLQDFFLTWAIVQPHMELTPNICVLWEHDGTIDDRIVAVPRHFQPEVEVALALQGATDQPPSRLAKNTQRSYHVCRFCPVKQTCDATDHASGATGDWGDGYPYP